MSSAEARYVVLAGSIALEGAVYEQGDILLHSQIQARAGRLKQMGLIREITQNEVENADIKEE